MRSAARNHGDQAKAAVWAMGLGVVLLSVGSCTATTAGSSSPATTMTVSATVTTVSTVTINSAAPVTTEVASTSDVASASAIPTAPSISPRQQPPDPCKLLTQAEADTLAGMALQASIGAGPDNGVNTLCQWTRDPNAGGVGQVSIIVGDGSKKALEIDKDTLGHAFTKVPGIGDECWQEEGGIWIRKGAVWVNIGLLLLDDPAGEVTPMRHAAKIVAGRL